MARRDEVVLAALDLLDEVGLDALSTRRLAARLGIQAASLYSHFPSKRALLEAMAGHLLRGVADEQPAGDTGRDGPGWLGWEDWALAARRVATGMRSAMLSRRDGARLLSTFHGPPEIGDHLFHGLIDRLVAAGAPHREASVAVDTLFGYVHGFTIEEQAHAELGPDTRFPIGVEMILAGIRVHLALGERAEPIAPESPRAPVTSTVTFRHEQY